MNRTTWQHSLAALALLAAAALSACDSPFQSTPTGKARVVQVVVTSPDTPTPVPAARASVASRPQASPTTSARPDSSQPYTPPGAPQTLSAAQVQATRQALEQTIAASDDRLRHGALYSTPTPTVVFQPSR